MIVRIAKRGTVALLTEKDSAIITVAKSTVTSLGTLYEEAYEIPNNNSAGFAITTPVAIFWYELDNLRDRIHIELLESVKHIVQWQTASALSVKSTTKHQDTKWT
jgi:hypothetical protein